MKKIIVIIALLLVAGFAQAQSWLEVEWAFQLGWIPYGNINFYQTFSVYESEPFNITFKIDARIFRFIKTGGQAISMFNKTDHGVSPVNFMPTGTTYQVYFGIELVKGISIIYEHSCSHPIIPFLAQGSGSGVLTAGYDRVYFEIKSKFCF